MSYGRFVAVIVGRYTGFFTGLCTVVLAVLLGTMLTTPRYVAEADVIVEPRASNAGLRDTGFLATEADLVRSQRVSSAVLRQLGLQKDPQLMDRWKKATGGRGDFEAWAADQLSRRLNVKPGRDSNILTIAYSSSDPQTAALTANAFVKAYVDTTNQIRQESAANSSETFGGRTRSLKAAVELAENNLAKFQRENGVSFTDERLDGETIRLTELNTQLVASQSATAAAMGRQKEASAGRAGMQEVLKDPLVASLSTEVAKLEGRVSELESRAGDQNPALIEQRSTLNAVRARLDQAMARAASSIAAESRIAAERTAALDQALAAQRARVLEVKAKRDQAQVLQREVELARKAYDSTVNRTNETILDSGAMRGSVSVVKAATVPHTPASPRLGVNMTASIVIGLLFAVAVAFWQESRDRRLRLDQDVVDQLEQPLLGVISNGRAAPMKLASH